MVKRMSTNLKEDIQKLRKYWDKWGKKIFPGRPSFLPKKSEYPILLSR